MTPRVVAVCDAVNRSGVSPSSSASVFEVPRDSQILGSDRLTASRAEIKKKQENHKQKSVEKKDLRFMMRTMKVMAMPHMRQELRE